MYEWIMALLIIDVILTLILMGKVWHSFDGASWCFAALDERTLRIRNEVGDLHEEKFPGSKLEDDTDE